MLMCDDWKTVNRRLPDRIRIYDFEFTGERTTRNGLAMEMSSRFVRRLTLPRREFTRRARNQEYGLIMADVKTQVNDIRTDLLAAP
jgi:hypothetical protein